VEPTRRDAELKGKVALVTGGGSGLGQALVGMLAEAEAIVVVADIREDRAEATAARVRASGGLARALAVDVADAGSAAAAVQAALDDQGRLDILVNNAGIDRTMPVEELSPGEWDRILAVNLSGAFHMARAAFPPMKRQAGGHIVNITSTAARRAWANAAAYHASKWGLLGLSHALHVEGRPHGIKVTAVIAGGMRTPFLLDRFPELDPALLQDPRNVADAVRFILGQPAETVVPEITVLPMRETSWP
jgi:NAD(P)-dependent dehydrogenase (short-subunit alcohol dehydrogenase family)